MPRATPGPNFAAYNRNPSEHPHPAGRAWIEICCVQLTFCYDVGVDVVGVVGRRISVVGVVDVGVVAVVGGGRGG